MKADGTRLAGDSEDAFTQTLDAAIKAALT